MARRLLVYLLLACRHWSSSPRGLLYLQCSRRRAGPARPPCPARLPRSPNRPGTEPSSSTSTPRAAPATGTTSARTPGLEHPDVLPAHANRLERMLDRTAPRGATLCVIATPPHSGGDACTVATVADHILIPVQPSAPDLRATSPDHPDRRERRHARHGRHQPRHRQPPDDRAEPPDPGRRRCRDLPRHAASTHRAQPRVQLRSLRRRDRTGHKAAVELVQLYEWLVSARALPTKETA